jgi:hypothetical protein
LVNLFVLLAQRKVALFAMLLAMLESRLVIYPKLNAVKKKLPQNF